MTAIRDLNLLHALDALLQQGSVTAAAHHAGMTTPAMSRALGRLREALGDPLLVRAGRAMVPTPYAIAIREPVHLARSQANELLGPAAHAPLTHVERTLSIRCSDAVAGLLAARLHARTRAEAPRVAIRFVPEGDEDAAELRDGTIDLDIGVNDLEEPELRRKVLFHDQFTLVVRRGHPLERGRLTLGRVAAADHIVVSRVGRARGPIDLALAAHGLQRRIAAVVPTFFAAMFAAASSDLIASVPRSLAAETQTRLRMRTLEVPLTLPPIAVGVVWHPRLDNDPAHRWLRECLTEIAAPFGAAPPRGKARPPGRPH